MLGSVPKVIFLQAAEFSGSKQDQRTMKTAVKIFLAFPSFQNWRSKIGPIFTKKKYIKNQSYQNMSIIKVGLFFIFFDEKTIQKDCDNF